MKNNKYLLSIVIIVVLFISRKTVYFFAYVIFGVEQYRALSEITKTLLVQTAGVLIPVLMVFVFNRFSIRKTIEDLGMSKGFKEGILFALLCTSPMYVGNFFFSPLQSDASLEGIFTSSIWPGFNEELIFRGILIGQLFKRAGWGFIPASLLSSVYFAIGHLYQSHDLASAIQIFMVTAIGGVGFAIFFIEWGWNIWFPMFMHIFMNMHTVFFETGGTAALNLSGNIFRAFTIGIAIFITIKRARKRGFLLKGNLWINQSTELGTS